MPTATREKPHRAPALLDSDSVESEVQPADLRTPPPPETESESDIVDLVMRDLRLSMTAKLECERDSLICTAFARGNQWVEWRESAGRMELVIDPGDPYRSYITVNLIRPILSKLKSRATQSKPDASVKPLTANPQDVQAADEARDILAHYDSLFNRQAQTLDWIDAVLDTSTTFLKVMWEPTKTAQTSWTGPKTGQTVEKAEVGDIEEMIVSSLEVFPDPSAVCWEDAQWLNFVRIRPLSWIQQRYDKRGYQVNPEAPGSSGIDDGIMTRLSAIAGNGLRSAGEGDKTAAVIERWEKPTPRYPKGRLIVVAGGVLLSDPENLDWPYEKIDDFPFVRLSYQTKAGTLWALNAVHDLIDLQKACNNTISRLNDRINTERPTILIAKHSEIGVDSYDSKRNYAKITYSGGVPPTYQAPPPVSASWFDAINLYKGLMEDIAGVHEVSNGSVPAGVTAGNAIELLQQSDNTQMSEFLSNIETACKQRAEWEIALCAQFYKEPRLVAVSQEDNPNVAEQNARTFESLRNGNVRVEVLPGSATPKTAAARIQQWQDFAKAGMLQPQNLPIFKALADLMGLERSDVVTQRVDEAIKEIIAQTQATQPNPAMAAQQQAMQQQEAQQHEAAMAQVQAETQIAVNTAKSQNQLQIEAAKAQAQQALQRLKDLGALEIQEHDKQVVGFNITGSMDPTAVASAEKAAGFDAKIPAPPVIAPQTAQNQPPTNQRPNSQEN